MSVTTVGRKTLIRRYNAQCKLPLCPVHKWKPVQREGYNYGVCLMCLWEEDNKLITVSGDAWEGGIVGKKVAAKGRSTRLQRAAAAAKKDPLQQTLMAFKGFNVS